MRKFRLAYSFRLTAPGAPPTALAGGNRALRAVSR